VVGVVVAKHAPITPSLKSAMEALTNNKSGMQYYATNEKGERLAFSEAQIVADLLRHQQTMTQVMLGEAIVVEELTDFLKANGIKCD
jgi:hypothetical protein